MERVGPDGQPLNPFFNRARRVDRDVSELLGLAKGLLADGSVTSEEAALIEQWVANHPSASEQWPVSVLAERLDRIFSDGRVDAGERRELADVLSSLVGGTAGVILGEDATASLPLDLPPPDIRWAGSVFVLTGKFAFGPRAACQHVVAQLGGACDKNVTLRTNYLIIGTFGSRDWIQTSFGRKIETAVEYRSAGRPLAIVGEDHWAKCVAAAV